MTPVRPERTGRSLAALAMGIAAMTLATPSVAEPSFAPLLGSWAGNGTYKLDDGTTERIQCDAYYTGSGSQLGIAVRCSNPKNKIEMRSKLSANGTSLSGSWEERTYNAGGEAKGTLSDSKIVITIAGGVTGSMTINYDQKTQSVAIATEGIPLKGVTVSLSRK